MRLQRVLAALYSAGIGIATSLDVVSAQKERYSVNHRKGQRALQENNGDHMNALPSARNLGLNAIEHGPKKAKSDKGSSHSGKEKGDDKRGDDDDDDEESAGKGGAPPTHAPTREAMSPTHTYEDMSPTHPTSKPHHPQPKEPKKSKKPKYESSKDKGDKLEKSTKQSPTHKPAPPPSQDDTPEPTPTPSDDGPTAPAPGPTLPPASENLRVLTPYQLVYTLSEYRVPFRSELLEVVELTRLYLEGYFKDEFEDDGDLLEFLTIFLDTAFDFGEPIPVEYESSAVFDPESTSSLPTVQDLDALLRTAFEGENVEGYIGMLQALPSINLFSKTIDVEITEPSIGDSLADQNTSATRDLTTATVAMAGTSGLLLIIAGVVLVRRNPEQEDDSEDEGSITGAKPCHTIGDETTTTAAALSFDQMSVPMIRHQNRSKMKENEECEESEADDDISSLCHPYSYSNRIIRSG